MTDAPFTVAVCTRGRPDKVRAALDSLASQRDSQFQVIVVDQSRPPDPELARQAEDDPRLSVIPDSGTGLSRARNIALRAAGTEWIAFMDDDCLVEPDFAAALRAEIEAHGEADWVGGHVGEHAPPDEDYVPVSTFTVDRPRWVSGGRTLPGGIGFGAFFAVKRSTAERLGGWDERFGPGMPEFPAADDMDFNYRLLRSGGVAWLSPRVRLVHEQWRSPAELAKLHRGYLRAWSGFAMKHLRSGDVGGGLRLWAWGAIDVLDMLGSALRRRSGLRLRLAAAKIRGLIRGTLRGATRSW
jgi:GT2 family glycosyltransferase